MKRIRLCSLLLVLAMLLSCAMSCTKPGSPNDDPSQETPDDNLPQEDIYVKLSEKGQKLYDATYQTMVDRLRENGYAQTSLTGAYQGMFIRDASIQVMAHIAEGDMEMAKSILQFMASYHKATNAKFAYHIMNELKADSVWDYIEKDMSIVPPELGPVPTSVASEGHSTALYKINMPNNGCATKFSVPFDTISEVSFYLELAGKKGDIVVSIGTRAGNNSVAETRCSIEELGSGTGWFTIKFDEPVTVQPGKKYVLSLWAEEASGNIISYGETKGGTGYNYDMPVFGGWRTDSQALAYRIRTDCSLTGSENAITQTFVAKGDVINTLEIETICSEKTKLYAALVDANGTELQKAVAETEGGMVSFDINATVTEGATYGLSVYAEKGEVIWKDALSSTVAYKTTDPEKAPLGETYSLRVYPEYSGTRISASASVGGNVIAKQMLAPNLNSLFVTSAKLYLAATGTPAAEDTFTVSLYKGDDLVSCVTRPVSTLSSTATAYDFLFSLPMEKPDENDSYSITVSASRADSVTWFGVPGKDDEQAAYVNSETKDMVLSYRAGISNVEPFSTMIQVDGNYMWVNAFAIFALEAGEEYEDFIYEIYDLMVDYSLYFVNNGYIHENGLVHNPNYEHSRNGRYWDGYDLITNCFTSEALHKMSLVAKSLGDTSNAERFAKIADDIAKAVHAEMISEFNGKKIYTELIALDEGGKIYKGFSFVSLAPIASDWYAVDEEIMANTYEAYLAVGTEKYSGIDMLGVVIELDENDKVKSIGNHVIGKGLGWEIYYLWKTGNTERLEQVLSFIDKRSNDVYPEVWRNNGTLADSANQEQASWILYQIARVTGTYKK